MLLFIQFIIMLIIAGISIFALFDGQYLLSINLMVLVALTQLSKISDKLDEIKKELNGGKE